MNNNWNNEEAIILEVIGGVCAELLEIVAERPTRRWYRDPHGGVNGLYEEEIVKWIDNERDDRFERRFGISISTYTHL